MIEVTINPIAVGPLRWNKVEIVGMSIMARLYLRRVLTGFTAANEPSAVLLRKYKVGEVYRAVVVKPRSYKHLRLIMALLNLTYEHLPERFARSFASFDQFRYAIAEASGHVESYINLEGEVRTRAKSISYDAIPDDVQFGKVAAAMMTVCAQILEVPEPELAVEVAKYADSHYGRAA